MCVSSTLIIYQYDGSSMGITDAVTLTLPVLFASMTKNVNSFIADIQNVCRPWVLSASRQCMKVRNTSGCLSVGLKS